MIAEVVYNDKEYLPPVEKGELLATIKVVGKSKQDADKQMDDLFHYPWKPHLYKKYDPKNIVIRTLTEAQWEKKNQDALSKGKERATKAQVPKKRGRKKAS